MDIGAIVKAPLEDQDWLKKCLLIGLFALIPIAGLLNAYGWLKAAFDARRRGETTLPEPSLAYIGEGFWFVVALLPIFGALMVFNIGGSIFAAILPNKLAGIFAIGFGLLNLVISLVVGIASPAIQYIYLTEGDRLASIRVARILEVIKSDVGMYVMLWVTIIIGQFVSGLGAFACGVGMLLTMPLGLAIQAAGLSAFAASEK